MLPYVPTASSKIVFKVFNKNFFLAKVVHTLQKFATTRTFNMLLTLISLTKITLSDQLSPQNRPLCMVGNKMQNTDASHTAAQQAATCRLLARRVRTSIVANVIIIIVIIVPPFYYNFLCFYCFRQICEIYC